jgi:FkbM family methyltransferase
MDDHPIFARFTGYHDQSASHTDWIGMRFLPHWWDIVPTSAMPILTEEYFEWIDLLEAVDMARERFTMLELGAGFGRWGIRGALAARQRGLAVDIRLVEGEPQHAAWACEALALNELAHTARVVEGAISYSGAPVQFIIQSGDYDARSWYGQCALASPMLDEPTERSYFGYPVRKHPWGQAIYVPPLTFESLTADLDRIDIVDMDIQAAEQELIENALPTFSAKVRMVHIGTHTTEIEASIRAAFMGAGWYNRWDFGCLRSNETPYGPVEFNDGVQGWLNPRFL